MEKIKLGTAYIDEFPLSPGLRSHKSDRISIGDTISSFAIQWVRLSNGLLVADRCICPNEWDATLAEAGEDDEVWCWMGQYFWGQETPEDWVSGRAVRGWVSARNWDSLNATDRYVDVGFRPALEALIPAPLDYGPLVGTEITLMDPNHKFITGMLVPASDYDLGLETHSPLPDISKWAIPDGERIIIDRASVGWLRKS